MVRRVYLDLDDVLADTIRFAIRMYGHKVPDPWPGTEYETSKALGLDMDPRDFWNQFNEHFWSAVPWMPDGKEILNVVEHRFGRENIRLLTKPTDNPGCLAGKLKWIHENMPDYRRQYFVGHDKWFIAAHHALLIDDSADNVDHFRLNGGHACLVPRPWNRLNYCKEPVNYLSQMLA